MQTADIEDTYKRKKEDLAQEMTDCGQMVANAFDRFVKIIFSIFFVSD